MSDELMMIEKLKKENEILKRNLKTCKHDYWLMSHLLNEKRVDTYVIKDCLERMEFRKPLFDCLGDSL